jgi:hypothetical protein
MWHTLPPNKGAESDAPMPCSPTSITDRDGVEAENKRLHEDIAADLQEGRPMDDVMREALRRPIEGDTP